MILTEIDEDICETEQSFSVQSMSRNANGMNNWTFLSVSKKGSNGQTPSASDMTTGCTTRVNRRNAATAGKIFYGQNKRNHELSPPMSKRLSDESRNSDLISCADLVHSAHGIFTPGNEIVSDDCLSFNSGKPTGTSRVSATGAKRRGGKSSFSIEEATPQFDNERTHAKRVVAFV